MRELPEKQNAEEDPGFRRHRAICGDPAAHGGQGARYGSDQGGQRTLPLQRGIEKHIGNQRQQRQQAGHRIHGSRKIHDAGHGYDRREDQGFQQFQTVGRERAVLRPLHLSVYVPFHDHVQCAGAPRRQSGPYQGVQQQPPIHKIRRTEIKAKHRRDHDQQGHPGFGQRQEIRGSCMKGVFHESVVR